MMIARSLVLSCIPLLSACAAHVTPPAVAAAPAVAAPEPAAPAPAACPIGDPQAALGSLVEKPSATLVRELGTSVDAYRLQDGVWLAAAPVLVNEEFDFGTAMGMGPVGAGLAAKQRQDHNKARAGELAALALSPGARQRLDALRACGIHRWALLWGGAQPILQVVSDVYDAQRRLVKTDVKELPAAALQTDTVWLDDTADR